MAGTRAVPWVAKAPEAVEAAVAQLSEGQGLATEGKLLLVGNRGATSFVLVQLPAEEGEDERPERSPQSAARRKVVVAVGRRHQCSACFPDRPAEAVCRHLVFVLHRVLKVPAASPLLWQLSFTDAEIERVLAGPSKRPVSPKSSLRARRGRPEERAEAGAPAALRAPEPGESCPICMDAMTPDDALAGCGQCGNLAHNRCMRVWAEHRVAAGEAVTCPLCRADWGSVGDPSALRSQAAEHRRRRPPAVHRRVRCAQCGSGPLTGRRYRCAQCGPGSGVRRGVDLCSRCFYGGSHGEHVFLARSDAVSLPRAPGAYLDRPGGQPGAGGGPASASGAAPRAGDVASLTTWAGWEAAERRGVVTRGMGSAADAVSAHGPDPTAGRSAAGRRAAALRALEGREITPGDFELLLMLDARPATLLQHLCAGLPCLAGRAPRPCCCCGLPAAPLSRGAAASLVEQRGVAGMDAPSAAAAVTRVLPCGHAAHEECLRERLAERDIVCPRCREEAAATAAEGAAEGRGSDGGALAGGAMAAAAIVFPGLLSGQRAARRKPPPAGEGMQDVGAPGGPAGHVESHGLSVAGVGGGRRLVASPLRQRPGSQAHRGIGDARQRVRSRGGAALSARRGGSGGTTAGRCGDSPRDMPAVSGARLAAPSREQGPAATGGAESRGPEQKMPSRRPSARAAARRQTPRARGGGTAGSAEGVAPAIGADGAGLMPVIGGQAAPRVRSAGQPRRPMASSLRAAIASARREEQLVLASGGAALRVAGSGAAGERGMGGSGRGTSLGIVGRKSASRRPATRSLSAAAPGPKGAPAGQLGALMLVSGGTIL